MPGDQQDIAEEETSSLQEQQSAEQQFIDQTEPLQESSSTANDANAPQQPETSIAGSINISEPPNLKPSTLLLVSRKLILQKFTVYECGDYMYVVGSNGRETIFRMLQIDIADPQSTELKIIEDDVIYTRTEVMDVLSTLDEESPDGLYKKVTGYTLLGFVKFTGCYYLSVVTKRSTVAVIGGHYVYHIDDTQLIPITKDYKKPDKYGEEARYLATFANLDLSKTFYYSYTYDLTNTLQRNILREKQKSHGLLPTFKFSNDRNDMFIWNSALLDPISKTYERVYDWFQPIIHGFIDQSNVSVFGKKIYITLIARRSQHFAGARFLKRGVNNQGNVANEVESEQIVSDMLTTGFHDARYGFFNNERYTSYVQHRGSIPLNWSQEGTNLKLAKPPIEINSVDPFYCSAALHFDDLFKRYDSPVLVLNLIKAKERTPRESKLLKEFEKCITYLNKFLPEEHKLQYTHWDMSRASKSDGQDVIEYLEKYADEALKKTGFFHNGVDLDQMKLQQGICRTNCIDCLDRTNAAQFIIGKRALGYQLHALGVIDDIYINYDSDVVNILTEMFHDHGDTIALQYGGSHLVNTMETYRKINQWSSHSRDMIESIKRFYSNSFVDAQRQEAINLFLGNYVWEKGKPMLWDLNTDYYLHNLPQLSQFKRSYRYWWTEKNLLKFGETFEIPKHDLSMVKKAKAYPGFFDNYWNEYYTPRKLTLFEHAFEINMNSTIRYITPQSVMDDKFEYSPFKPRKMSLINHKLRRAEVRKRKNEEEKQKEKELDESQYKDIPVEEFKSLIFKNQLRELKLSSLAMEALVLQSSHDLGFDAVPEYKYSNHPGGAYDEEKLEMLETLSTLDASTDTADSNSVTSSTLFYEIERYENFKSITVTEHDLKLYEEVCSSDHIRGIRNKGKSLASKISTDLTAGSDRLVDQLPEVKGEDLKLYESITNLGIVGDYLNETGFACYEDNERSVMNFYV